MLHAVEANFPDTARQRRGKHTPALAGGAREMDNVPG
jgi:hypothetical protein